MADNVQGAAAGPLILKKKIKIPAGAHGGAWKVAYADFVTAMMAFFLLLWLLNATTEDQMNGLSTYFAPPSISHDSQGIGEAMAGMVAAADGAMRSASSQPTTSIAVPSYGSADKGNEIGTERDSQQKSEIKTSNPSPEKEEQDILNDTMEKLKQSIQEDPLVRDLQDSIEFDLTDEGLLIQLLDYQKREMFEPGTSIMTRRAIRLLALISGITVQLPNNVTLTGHTDSGIQSGATPDYGNWELSSDRAAASRRWMEENGFPPERLVRVEGKADTDLLDKQNPLNERNRRISILLLRKVKLEKETDVTDRNNSAEEQDSPPPALPAIDESGAIPPPLPPSLSDS